MWDLDVSQEGAFLETQIKLQIDLREPFADGMSFDSTGAYERLKGRIHFSIDPGDRANRRITDLNLAPRNAQGLVEYATDFYLLKPIDLNAGNRRLIYDVNNRGNKRILQFFNFFILFNILFL